MVRTCLHHRDCLLCEEFDSFRSFLRLEVPRRHTKLPFVVCTAREHIVVLAQEERVTTSALYKDILDSQLLHLLLSTEVDSLLFGHHHKWNWEGRRHDLLGSACPPSR